MSFGGFKNMLLFLLSLIILANIGFSLLEILSSLFMLKHLDSHFLEFSYLNLHILS